MNIQTKYKIGDEVYVILKDDNSVLINMDSIEEIAITKKELGYDVSYYLEHTGDEFSDEELISIRDDNTLIYRINKLLGL